MSDSTPERATLFFDLDGTLTNPRDGITKCLQHGLKCLGWPCPEPSELVQYIGPPLRWTFPRLLGTDDEALVEAAIRHYRERFADVGLFENEMYEGIPQLLASLQQRGFRLHVVTSKPTVYASRIIRHFGLDPYFEGVHGPELDGRFDEKTELVGHLLHSLPAEPHATVMIGDRASDIAAGKAHGTRTIGVTYGFGDEQELATAGADCICRDSAEILQVLGNGFTAAGESA